MTEQRLNNLLLLHVHKDITDQLNLIEIAQSFVDANDRRKLFLGAATGSPYIVFISTSGMLRSSNIYIYDMCSYA